MFPTILNSELGASGEQIGVYRSGDKRLFKNERRTRRDKLGQIMASDLANMKGNL